MYQKSMPSHMLGNMCNLPRGGINSLVPAPAAIIAGPTNRVAIWPNAANSASTASSHST